VTDLVFVLDKETKNMVRYDAKDEGGPIPNLYVRKAFFSGLPPETITITLVEGKNTK